VRRLVECNWAILGEETGWGDWARRLGQETGPGDWARRLGKETGRGDWARRLGEETGRGDWARRLGDWARRLPRLIIIVSTNSESLQDLTVTWYLVWMSFEGQPPETFFNDFSVRIIWYLSGQLENLALLMKLSIVECRHISGYLSMHSGAIVARFSLAT
jgi:hypothetical protein